MERSALQQAARLLLEDNVGTGQWTEADAGQLADRVVAAWPGGAAVKEFAVWWGKLSREEQIVACMGCDVSVPGGDHVMTSGEDEPETVLVVPLVPHHVLETMFEMLCD